MGRARERAWPWGQVEGIVGQARIKTMLQLGGGSAELAIIWVPFRTDRGLTRPASSFSLATLIAISALFGATEALAMRAASSHGCPLGCSSAGPLA